jgi:hypothetical protein
MNNTSILIICEELIFSVGEETFVTSSTNNGYAVVFEDNGETGYFYAVRQNAELEILDALHIYNVEDVVDRAKPSTLKLLWTTDESKAFLSINNYYHAVFDFQARAGYGRNGFPGPNKWTLVKERLLTESLLVAFATLP